MAERRPLSFYTSGDYDYPPATTTTPPEYVTTHLNSLRRSLQRERESERAHNEAERHALWANPPNLRRRRTRPSESLQPTYEERPYVRSQESVEIDEGRQRSMKRRKLDHYPAPIQLKSYKYGHYGQVEPGQLKLRVHSCDGGTHDERGSVYFGPENILRHDQSVYCSENSFCNIILEHHDRSAFCLEKLYIVTPDNGFTAAVKDGLVYVAMSHSELRPMMNSANDLPEPAAPMVESDPSERLTLLESLGDPEVASAVNQRNGREIAAFLDYTNSSGAQGRLIRPSEIFEQQSRDSGWPTLEPLSLSSTRPQSPTCDDQTHTTVRQPGMRVTVRSDEDIEWPEEPTSSDVLDDRQRRQRSMRGHDEEDAYGFDPRFHTAYGRRTRYGQLRRGIRPTEPRRSVADDPVEEAQEQTSVSREVTRARFHIKNGKNKVAITFDPPVSGSYILLQLQTPFAGRNIDLQTVVACGYAGPRFFPACEFA